MAISPQRTTWRHRQASGPWHAPRRIGGKIVANAPKDPYAALLKHYLTPRHRDDPGHGCAFAALSADAARCDRPVRSAFAQGLEALIEIVTKTVPGRSKAARRRRAVATVAELVGALILSRAVDDAALSDEILEAVKHNLMDAAAS